MATAALACDHSALIHDRAAWQSLPFVALAGHPGAYYEQRLCSCGLILERSLEKPWPVEETDAFRACREIARAAREYDAHVCQCGHKRIAHGDGVAGCVAGACACCSFRRVK